MAEQINLDIDEQTIKTFSDDDLLASLDGLFCAGRKISRLALLHLLEIEARRLYAKRGYDSLFTMLIKNFKLSEASANSRIKAMQLLKVVPAAQEKLVSGEVNLTTLSMAQAQIRREEKLSGRKISDEKKREIVDRIKNMTQAETEVELFHLLPETALSPRNHEKRVSASETRLGPTVPDRVLNKLKRLREIWSHVDPNMDYLEIIERCADETLKRVDPMVRGKNKVKTSKQQEPVKKDVSVPVKQSATESVKRCATTNLADEKQTKASSAKPPGEKQAKTSSAKPPYRFKRFKYFPVEIEREIWSKAHSQCEFVDLLTGRRCCSRFLLQIDHVISISAGGTNNIENLQLLCAIHNRLKYKLETENTRTSDHFVPYESSQASSRNCRAVG